MLLGRNDLNPDTPNEYGQTQLCSAAEDGHERVVRVLLGGDDVNPTNWIGMVVRHSSSYNFFSPEYRLESPLKKI